MHPVRRDARVVCSRSLRLRQDCGRTARREQAHGRLGGPVRRRDHEHHQRADGMRIHRRESKPLQTKRLYGHKSLSPGQRQPDLPWRPEAHRAGKTTSRQRPHEPPASCWHHADHPYALRRAAIARACSPSLAYVVASLRHERGARPCSARARQDQGRGALDVVSAFQKLAAAMCAGSVGAVFCIEASRLPRNGRDRWNHLIDLRALAGALVIDPDGDYDTHHCPGLWGRCRSIS